MANETSKFFNSVAAGKKASDRMNFAEINSAFASDYVGSDIHQSSSSLNTRQDAFIFGFDLWGSDDRKVI